MEFQQSEQIGVRRRWIMVLVDSTDGVTGKTGQTGTVKISKNGGTPVTSTNNIVEVNSANMPGHYYIELTAGELSDLGMISIYYKAASTLAFHDRGFITYNNPFQSQGGFATAAMGGNSSRGGITKPQAAALLEAIRKMIKEELQQQEVKEVNDERIDVILAAVTKETDLSPVLEAIGNIELSKDYTPEFSTLTKQLIQLGQDFKLDVTGFTEAVVDFTTKMVMNEESLNSSTKEVETIIEGFNTIKTQIVEFNKTFDSTNSLVNNTKIDGLTKKLTDLAVAITHLKYDIKMQVLT